MKTQKMMRCQEYEDGIINGPYPIQETRLRWVLHKNGETKYPRNMFSIGKIETGEEAFVARIILDKETVPGFLLKSTGLAYIPYNNEELQFGTYEIMIVERGRSGLQWVKDSNCKNYNDIALKAGKDNGELLLIGRTNTPPKETVPKNENTYRPGKISRAKKSLFVPYEGKEVKFSTYETLVMRKAPTTLVKICCWNIIKYMELSENNKKSNIDILPLPRDVKEMIKKSGKEIKEDKVVRLPMFVPL